VVYDRGPLVGLRLSAVAAGLLALAPAGLAAPPAPSAGKSVVLTRVSGTVRVKQPGRAKFVVLRGTASVPLRTTVDTLKGVVRLRSADGTGVFYAGSFQIFEPKTAPPGAGKGRLTDLHLVGGDFASCTRALAGGHATGKPIRRLWGNAKGRFRTKGRYAAATVRGTVWLTLDTCTESEVSVRKGVVGVRDLVLGKTVVVKAGQTATASPQVAPVNTAPPSISGSLSVGQPLTASAGSWTGTPQPTFAFQWQRCDTAGGNCVDIAGATSATYVVQQADVGSTLRVRVTATNPAGSASAVSPPTTVVATAPVNTARPAISGTPTLGSTLTAAPGTWSGSPAPTFAYQWQRCDAAGNGCVAIAGATAQTYALQSSDEGATVRVQVTATNSAGTANAVSPAVGPVRPGISIADVALNEGSQGTTNFVFTVSLSAASSQTVTVAYATANDTAGANDFRPAAGTLTFAPGQTSATITVVVVGDTAVEPDEQFFVNLTNAVNAVITDAQAVGTIRNDDVSSPRS
jgi:Calx-beta domain